MTLPLYVLSRRVSSASSSKMVLLFPIRSRLTKRRKSQIFQFTKSAPIEIDVLCPLGDIGLPSGLQNPTCSTA